MGRLCKYPLSFKQKVYAKLDNTNHKKSMKEIARELNIPVSTVYYIKYSRLDVKSFNKLYKYLDTLSEKTKEDIYNLYLEGCRIDDIVNVFNVPLKVVNGICKCELW